MDEEVQPVTIEVMAQPPSSPPPERITNADDDAPTVIISDDSSDQERLDTAKTTARATHMAELLRLTSNAIGCPVNRIKRELDQSRGQRDVTGAQRDQAGAWRAWSPIMGDGSTTARFELAELKAEAKTELGALRRLANSKRAKNSDDQPRPVVASGVNLLDALDKRHLERESKRHHGGWGLKTIGAIVITALAAVNAFLLIGREHPAPKLAHAIPDTIEIPSAPSASASILLNPEPPAPHERIEREQERRERPVQAPVVVRRPRTRLRIPTVNQASEAPRE